MNQLTRIFDGQELIVIEVNNEPKFLLKDVCSILEIGHAATVRKRLDDDVVSNHPIQDSLGRIQQATFVNEDGLYDVILDSRKPEAKRFRKWITSEVLPSIRKTGAYNTSNIIPLNDKQSLIAVMRLSAMTAEETEELKQVTENHSNKLQLLEKKIDNEITLDHGEQRRLQKGIASKVYELCDNPADRPKLFKELYREIKDRFGVSSYKDVKRHELQAAIRYVESWIPRRVS